MIVTARPALARAMRAGLPLSHGPVRFARPLTVGVRAFHEDEKQKHAAAAPQPTDQEQQQSQVQVSKQAGAPITMRSHPAMRLPSLFHEMQREMDAMSRLFGLPSMLDDGDLFSLSSRAPRMLQLPDMPRMAPMLHLATDIEEDDKAITIKADCPGM